MKTIKTLRSAALATFAVAAVSLPTLAQAQTYNSGYYNPSAECKSDENDAQLVGGLLGAAIGGVAGSEIAGRGDQTEGAVIGAIIGGIAGAAIGDESVNCDKRRGRAYNTNYSGQTYGNTRTITRNGYQTVTYPYGYDNNRRYDNRRGYNNGRGYNNSDRRQLQDVRYRLRDLRDKNARIERRLRRHGHNYELVRRQERVCNEILRLEKKERRLSRRVRNNRRGY